ncbi:hypothetical protein PIROE2DRAFT_19961 [Piromyces sp. E2]|nr:hypothetical protein PIROE2DRAFT_19961 [Piromyces sp. E2]|eukprot:OUM67832.1 hypothetical protein PIROE2DRAFT_19961 [Piromyces sp. E2]
MKIKNLFHLLSVALVSAKAIKEEVKPELPIFNLESGFYKDSSVKLKIKTSDPKAIIYYTTDGSIPNENSTIYKKPITLRNKSFQENVLSAYKGVDPYEDFIPHEKIKKANVIRAMAKYPNKNNTVSEVVSKTYWVGMNRKKLYGELPLISLMTDPDNLFDYEKGIYIMGKDYDDWVRENPENADVVYYNKIGNFNRKGKKSEVAASLEYLPGDRRRQGFTDNVGIRIMGGVSRTFIQKSFRVTYREDYGKKNLKYEILPGNMRSDGKGPIEKYKTFNIRNGGNDFKFIVFRDHALQTLVRDRNFETQNMDLAVLYLDGEFWGVYDITEDYSDHYIENNYGIDKDNVIIIKKDKVEAGVDSDIDLFNQAMQTILSTDLSVPENYAKIGKQFDIESFAWYGAFNIYIENRDGIFQNNNWAMWRVREPVPDVLHGDGVWRMMLFDTESSAGLNRNATNYDVATVLDNALDPTSSLSDRIGSRLLVAFMKNREFKNLFINALSDMRNIDFALDKVNPLLKQLDGKVRRVMTDHFIRYGYEEYIQEGPTNHYANQFYIFKSWLNGRSTIFMDYLAKVFHFKPAVKVTVTSDSFRKGGFTVNGGKKVFTEKYKGLYFRENVLYLTAVPKKGRTFKYWEVDDCKFANPDYSVSRKYKLKQATVGVYPSKGCKVVAYFK